MGEYLQNNAKPVTKEVFYGSYLLVVLEDRIKQDYTNYIFTCDRFFLR